MIKMKEIIENKIHIGDIPNTSGIKLGELSGYDIFLIMLDSKSEYTKYADIKNYINNPKILAEGDYHFLYNFLNHEDIEFPYTEYEDEFYNREGTDTEFRTVRQYFDMIDGSVAGYEVSDTIDNILDYVKHLNKNYFIILGIKN